MPVAIDSWEYRHGEGSAHRFYVALAEEALLNRPDPDGMRSYQGHYIATPDGRLLAAANRRGSAAVAALAAEGLSAWEALEPDGRRRLDPAAGPDRPRSLVRPALVLVVYSRVHDWDDALQSDRSPFQRAQMEMNEERVGLDHLWLTSFDLALLTPRVARVGHRWRGPRSLARRIGRFHLVDNVRGEPPHYLRSEVERSDLDLIVEAVDAERIEIGVSGAFGLQATDEARHFRGSLTGRLVWDRRERRFTRFDLLADGSTTGQGRWTPGAPAGEFRLEVAFELPPDDFAVEVPPQGMRNRAEYLFP